MLHPRDEPHQLHFLSLGLTLLWIIIICYGLGYII
jgi:hypothetical protein